MSAWKYKQLMPKVLVSKLRLIQTKDMLDLIGSPLDRVYSQLTKTPYHKEISEISPQPPSSTSLEEALLKSYIRTVDEIAHCSPRGIRALLREILMKFEASSVKTILRTKMAGIEVDQAVKYIISAGRLDASRCEEILKNSGNVREVVKLLSDLEYGPVLDGAMEEYDKTGVLLPLEVAVDKHVYSRIWKAAKKLRGLDGRIARTIVGLEIDSMNIRVVLRFQELGIDKDRARQYLMPISSVLGRKELENAIRAKEPDSTIKHLLDAARINLARDYQRLLMELKGEYEVHKSLSRAETILDRELLKTSLRMLKRYTPFFNIGFVLAFLNLKWYELRNLRTIIRGAEEDISPAKTKELIILPY